MEVSYPYQEFISISQLRLDVQNPRLPNVQDSQIDAMHTMARVEQDKLIALGNHIVEYGLNPADRFIVVPDEDDTFAVLDGNRRLTVLRALNNPDSITHHLSERSAKQLATLANRFELAPIVEVPCTVFEDREHADRWVELIHDGESRGAGLVKWSSQQRSRFHARKGQKPFHLQILDYVAENGNISDDTKAKIELGRFPASTLKRLLGTPYVRDKLGVDKVDGEALTTLPRTEVLKGLSRVVEDIGSGRVKVGSLMTQTDRINYINGIDESDLPDTTHQASISVPLDNAPDTNPGSNVNQKKPRERQHSSLRKRVIPSDLRLEINLPRVNDVYIELKRRLTISETPNAVAVLIRVLFELSVDEYLDQRQIQVQGRDTLANKVTAIADYMQNNGILSQNELRPIRRASSSDATVQHSITTLHGYLHNRRQSPGPDDLRAMWDNLELFITKLWE